MSCCIKPRLSLTVSRETKQKTLEEIAAAFGDKVVEVQATEDAVIADGKVHSEHSERA
jgi:hypothetical protein